MSIQLKQVTYTYPDATTPALQAVDWTVQTGEFVLVAGASGSGKSTLLRCLNGLVPHFSGGQISGTVQVNGLDVIRGGPTLLSRQVGFVLQNPEAQAILDTVEPEIAFGLENMAVPPDEMRLRVEEVLTLLDLAPLRQRPLAKLSGGERQRVAIAAALALRPRILVLDEPTSQLDPQSADDVLRALVRLNEDLGLTIILAEHRLERVLRYADRITYLENGRLLVDAPLEIALPQLPQLPPLPRLGRALGWHPLPRTIKEAQRHVRPQSDPSPPPPAPQSAPAEPLLTISDVSFAYNGRSALERVSLTVQAGEVVVLMGRNGSGKSTLLKNVVGLLPLGAGEVVVNGRSIQGRDVADICREVAYLPQNPDDLLFAETVSEELNITLKNHHLEHLNGVAALLSELGLTAVADAYPRDLSVGQRQRVALGAVTITRPRLLLLDEPTRGLDYVAKQTLVHIWRRWLEQGMGLLLVTHDVELAAMIADRVVILSEGSIIAQGETRAMLNASPLFAPQMARLFPQQGWLTVEEVLQNYV